MRTASVLLLVLCLLAFSSETVVAFDIVGEARDVASGDLLYHEQHNCNSRGTTCLVSYLDTDGALFAQKQVDYSASLSAPSLTFEDFRTETIVQVVRPPRPGLVIDAGFDHFVRMHWTELDAGVRLPFQFLPAGRDAPLNMIASRALRSNCPATQLCLQIALQSRLFSLFVDPIRLTYTRATRRLLRYTGLSNIADAAGGTLDVDIFYTYLAATDPSPPKPETLPAVSDQS